MYRMYVSACKENGEPYAKLSMYETIFNTEYNIGFCRPKKDQCAQCDSYKNSSAEEKIEKQATYDSHILEKQLSRAEKESDVKNAEKNKNLQVCCFDLQAVIVLPCGDVSQFYYKRRLSCYNFTVFNISEKKERATYGMKASVKEAQTTSQAVYISIYKNVRHMTLYFMQTTVLDSIKISLWLLFLCFMS